MAIRYKLDILEALKSKGFSTYKLRKEKLLSEGVIQSLRSQKMISLENVGQLCSLLDCQPGDLLEYVRDDDTMQKGFYDPPTVVNFFYHEEVKKSAKSSK